jgi:hypothetical protein
VTLLKYCKKPGNPARVEFSQWLLWQHITSGILIACDEAPFSDNVILISTVSLFRPKKPQMSTQHQIHVTINMCSDNMGCILLIGCLKLIGCVHWQFLQSLQPLLEGIAVGAYVMGSWVKM